MKLKISQIIKLANSLAAVLNGRVKVIRQNNQDATVTEGYSIGADTLLALAINQGKLQSTIDAYEKARRAIIINGHKQLPSPDEMTLVEAIFALGEAEAEDIKLRRIEVSALKLDDNPGIGASLDGLMPILRVAANAGDEE